MNPLMVGAQSINQGMGSIGNAIGSNIAQQNQQNQQAEQMQQMKVLGEKAMSGDTEALSQLSMINPRAAQFIDGQLTQQATQQQQGQEKTDKATVDFVRSLNSAPKGQQEAMFNWAVEQEHLDVDEEDREHFSNPAIRRAIIGEQESEKSNVGTVSPKDFTVESIAEYERSGNIADLSRFSPKTVNVAGVEHQLNAETQKWEPIVDATSDRLNSQAKAIATLEADKKSRVDFGKNKVKWQTGRPKFKSKIASSRASQKILEATSAQLKSNINGWSTKYGSSLSSLPGSEARRLKNQLNTLKAHSAFSTLTDLKDSGGTLGAISEAELVLLEAKLGALDQGGDSAELLRVIDQIVNSNKSSIGRLETEFHNTNAMYSGGFDDLEQYAPKNQSSDDLSDEDLIKQYLEVK